jgi:predicted Mrr-cat superfamily restriction endonuclease
MSLWLIKHPANDEAHALDSGLVALGWSGLPELTEIGSRADLDAWIRALFPEATPDERTQLVWEIWGFARRATSGDIVAMPCGDGAFCAVGRFVSGYRFESASGLHSRRVEWVATRVPMNRIEPLMRHLLRSPYAVARIGEAEDGMRPLRQAEATCEPRRDVAPSLGPSRVPS